MSFLNSLINTENKDWKYFNVCHKPRNWRLRIIIRFNFMFWKSTASFLAIRGCYKIFPTDGVAPPFGKKQVSFWSNSIYRIGSFQWTRPNSSHLSISSCVTFDFWWFSLRFHNYVDYVKSCDNCSNILVSNGRTILLLLT